jgi:hypothetical protein
MWSRARFGTQEPAELPSPTKQFNLVFHQESGDAGIPGLRAAALIDGSVHGEQEFTSGVPAETPL